MSEISRKAIYKYFNGKEYERINLKTTAEQIDCDDTHRFVTDDEKKAWSGKADNVAATKTKPGIMSASDKKKLDEIEYSIQKMVLKNFYPVGSIYMSVSDKNPGDTMGGTWIAWGEGMVPVGVGGSGSNFSKVEQKGGNETLTLRAEVGGCDGDPTRIAYKKAAAVNSRIGDGIFIYGPKNYEGIINPMNYNTPVVDVKQKGEVTNIMNPYITCYMWKRTA